jgi:hypothetical protein
VWFSDCRFIWMKDDLGLLVVNVQTTEEQDETGERSIAGDGFEPVI